MNRTRQAGQLSHLLSTRLRIQVTIEYHGKRRGIYGGWHVQWTDGPSKDEMAGLVFEYRARFPLVEEDLRLVRGSTETIQPRRHLALVHSAGGSS
ncbi:hypothetical protein [Streptomyces sp. NPDC055990]|uniref:hypothetical protein n=1 Tax=Streptomyces sp. NPDC055990 TaxID=3345672 RepID=UPI0035D5F892